MSLLTHSPYSVPTLMYPCSYVGVHVCIHLPKCVYALTHACPNVHQSKILDFFSSSKINMFQRKTENKMFCEIVECEGYVLLHDEGSTCTKCNRLQQGAPFLHQNFENHKKKNIFAPTTRREIEHLAGRHLLSDECATHADNLFTLVRTKQIKYARMDLTALCISQAVFAKYTCSISLNQISALLNQHFSEALLRRKHEKLCKIFPKHFHPIPFKTPPFGISLLGLTPKKESSIRRKTDNLLVSSNFNFSRNVALHFILRHEHLCSDNQLLDFISSYPPKHEHSKCRKFLEDSNLCANF